MVLENENRVSLAAYGVAALCCTDATKRDFRQEFDAPEPNFQSRP